MSLYELFVRSNKTAQVFWAELCLSWQPKGSGKAYCPSCKSEKFYKKMQRRNGKIFICGSCKQNFSEEDFRECICLVPGRLAKCLDCIHYQQLRTRLKQRMKSSPLMTIEEAEQRLVSLTQKYKDRRLSKDKSDADISSSPRREDEEEFLSYLIDQDEESGQMNFLRALQQE